MKKSMVAIMAFVVGGVTSGVATAASDDIKIIA